MLFEFINHPLATQFKCVLEMVIMRVPANVLKVLSLFCYFVGSFLSERTDS